MSKHTPGPWSVSEEFDGTSIKAGMFHVTHTIQACGFHETAEDKAVTQANARLIAAAPDLLEALTGCVCIIRNMGTGVTTFERQEADPESALNQARAAIAKATGERA